MCTSLPNSIFNKTVLFEIGYGENICITEISKCSEDAIPLSPKGLVTIISIPLFSVEAQAVGVLVPT